MSSRFVCLLILVCIIGAFVLSGLRCSEPCGRVLHVTGSVIAVRGPHVAPLEPGAPLYPNELFICHRGRATLLLNAGGLYEIYPDSRSLIRAPQTAKIRTEQILGRLKSAILALMDGYSGSAGPHSATIIAVRG